LRSSTDTTDTDGAGEVARFAVRTRDPELAHELISQTYARHRPRVSGSNEGFRFSLSTAVAGPVASDVMIHSMDTRLVSDPPHHLTAAYLARGSIEIRHGREEERFGPGEVMLYPYGTEFEAHWTVMDQGLLRLDFDAIARLAAQQTGADARAFRFLGMRALSPAMGRYWCSVTGLVHRELAVAQPVVTHPLVLAQLEATLTAAALSVFPNTTLTAAFGAPAGYVGPAALRRAVAYIDAHAGEAITLGDIAAAAGVGARALQYAFAQHHGTSPMGYLRRVRLERAHRDLKAADPGLDRIGQIALRWGFAKPSRFAGLYHRAYGVNPHDTLRGPT
jgi:AraC-like DNA-binding protein